MQRFSSGKLIIDLAAIRQNYKIVQEALNQSTRSAAVVKADAYGLGAQEVVGALLQEGCRDFFVATPYEALSLRRSYKDCNIYVLQGYFESCADDYERQNLIPVLGSFVEIQNYKSLGQKYKRSLPAYLHFNTRMNRLGLGSIEAEELLANISMLEGINVQGVMSHLACADEADHPMTKTQHDVFKEIAAHFPNCEKSLSNSSGVFRDQAYHFDLVRPGMALYGLNPTPEKNNPMHLAVSLQVPILRTRIVYAGAVVGYGATHRFDEDVPLATVSAGYADGLFGSLANRGALYWRGFKCPVRGRVSMDMTTVDLSNLPKDQRPKPGDYLEVLGPHQSVDDLAAAAGTIGYEVLTALGQRYERIYKGSIQQDESVPALA